VQPLGGSVLRVSAAQESPRELQARGAADDEIGMILDLAALLILALFALMGAVRGGVASVAGLVTLVLSYGAAVFAAQNLGDPVSTQLGVSPFVGPIIAGTAVFLSTAIVVSVLGSLVRRALDARRGDEPMGGASRCVGATFGLVRGAFVVLLLGWLAIWIDAARETGSFTGLASAPKIEESALVKATEVVVTSAVTAAMDDGGPGSQVVARFASKPGQSVRSIQAVLASPKIEALQQDRFFWTLIVNGSFDRAINRKSFREIVDSEELRAHFASLGVISPEAGNSRDAFKRELGGVLAEVGPRVRDLADDPELQKLARDPQITALLEQGDALGLMRHEGIQRLAARVSSP
jgi:uncharacterized membrane protein required for colicin V production